MVVNDGEVVRFVKLLTENQTRIFTFSLSRVPRSADADDLLQETTRVMWEKFGSFELDTNFMSWALTIARYNILNYYRKANNQLQILNELAIKNIDAVSGGHDNSDQRIDALRECVKLLPKKQSVLLQMRFTGGVDVKTIARQLSRSIPAVYGMFAKIHLNLMHCIKNRIAMEDTL